MQIRFHFQAIFNTVLLLSMLIVCKTSNAQQIDVKHFCNTVTAFYEGRINQYKVGATQNSGNNKVTRLILPPTISDAKVSMFLMEDGKGSAIRYMVSTDTLQYDNILTSLRKIIGENSENYPDTNKYSKGLIFLAEPSQDIDLHVINIAYSVYEKGIFVLPYDTKSPEYSLTVQLKKEVRNNSTYVFIEIAKFFDKPTHNVLHLLYRKTSSLLWEEGGNIDWAKIEKETVENNQKKDKIKFETYAERLKARQK